MDIQPFLTSRQDTAQSTPISSLADDFDSFLTLLTTQLQNQDPLQPLDTQQFTEQLVQFAGVEQSIQTNASLDTLIALQTDGRRESAIGLIGKTVSVDAATHPLEAQTEGDVLTWRYTVPPGVEDLTLTVRNSAGETVDRLDARGGQGEHLAVWRADAPGRYTLGLETSSAQGPMTGNVEARFVVDSVRLDEGEPRLAAGSLTIALDDILRVESN